MECEWRLRIAWRGRVTGVFYHAAGWFLLRSNRLVVFRASKQGC